MNELPFITRRATMLYEGNGSAATQFRFSGANVYWLGLDDEDGPLRYPDQFRVRDVLATVVGMGGKVVRCKTCGTSTGNSLSFEPRLDKWNSAALDSIDFAMAVARNMSLRIIPTLTDNGNYYHGGILDFCRWINRSTTLHECQNGVFYEDRRVIAAFKRYVHRLLTRKNRYNGVVMANDSTIFCWQTGNELSWSQSAWTREIAQFLKSLSPNILVCDGRYGVGIDDLAIPEVDLYDDHFYPPWILRLDTDVSMTSIAQKAFIVGEYDWKVNGWGKNGSSLPFLERCLENRNISGALFWSLHSHAPKFGFVGTAMRYPGEDPFLRDKAFEQMRFAANMSQVAVVPPFVPTIAPLLHPLVPSSTTHDAFTVSWRGSAGACQYNVLARPAATGTPSEVKVGVTDYELPVQVSLKGFGGNASVAVVAFGCDESGRLFRGPTSNWQHQ